MGIRYVEEAVLDCPGAKKGRRFAAEGTSEGRVGSRRESRRIRRRGLRSEVALRECSVAPERALISVVDGCGKMVVIFVEVAGRIIGAISSAGRVRGRMVDMAFLGQSSPTRRQRTALGAVARRLRTVALRALGIRAVISTVVALGAVRVEADIAGCAVGRGARRTRRTIVAEGLIAPLEEGFLGLDCRIGMSPSMVFGPLARTLTVVLCARRSGARSLYKSIRTALCASQSRRLLQHLGVVPGPEEALVREERCVVVVSHGGLTGWSWAHTMM